MARRRRFRTARRSISKGFGIARGGLMSGFVRPTGMIGSAALGLGAAAATRNFINTNFAWQDEAVALATGGLPGAAAVYILKRTGMPSSGTGVNPY